jgi:phosphopantothenoylcysteine synthetase/decarboxylase
MGLRQPQIIAVLTNSVQAFPSVHATRSLRRFRHSEDRGWSRRNPRMYGSPEADLPNDQQYAHQHQHGLCG